MKDVNGKTFGTNNTRPNIVQQKRLQWEILTNKERHKNLKKHAEGGNTLVTLTFSITDNQPIGPNVEES